MSPRWIESGRPEWPVYLVAEAPGHDEVIAGRPLVGQSGQELDRMLVETGFDPARLFRTNVCHERPPSYRGKTGQQVHNDISQFFLGSAAAERQGLSLLHGRFPAQPVRDGLDRLLDQLNHYRPQLVIALGGTSLWAAAGCEGITKWRGSVLDTRSGGKAVCTFHPADVLRQWTHRPIVLQDLRRALRESAYPEIRKPPWQFVVAPTLSDVRDWLIPRMEAGVPLVCDTEGWGVVDCIGFADSSLSSICIPIIHETGDEQNYWCIEDELAVVDLCIQALRRCPITFHNGLWDCQVIAREWGVMPQFSDDTQVMQHVAFPGLLGGKIDPVTGRVDKKGSSLSLSFIASMYCDYYRFWKDDGRHFDASVGDELDYWRYNCEDCVRTFECRESLLQTLEQSGLTEQYRFEMSLFAPVFKMMFRGVRLDRLKVREMRAAVNVALRQEQRWLNDALGFELNAQSSSQVQALLYNDFNLLAIKDRKTGNPTANDQALETIARRQPLLAPLVKKIQNIRTLITFGARGDAGNQERGLLATAEAAGDRLLTCFNVGYVETLRFSSNQTAFGEGGNLQNLPRSNED